MAWSPHGATSEDMAKRRRKGTTVGDTPGEGEAPVAEAKKLIPQPHGGALMAPGTIHRGPDRLPRRQIVRAVFLHAMGNGRTRPSIDHLTGRLKYHPDGSLVLFDVPPGKMVEDLATSLQLVAERAALGFNTGEALALLRQMHEAFLPTKGEDEDGGAAPTPATFVYEDGQPADAPKTGTGDPGKLVDADGHEYVAG